MKVLVVEDDRSIQMVLELVLSRMGKCDVLLASEGRQGLSMIKEHKPDVILLDLMLPGIDGFEICQRAKEDPETKQIPIIFLTAQPQPAAIARAMSLGAAAYLIKPFDPTTIITQINEALAKAQVPPEVKRMSEPVLDLSEIMGLYKEDARRSVQNMRTAVNAWDQVISAGPAAQELRKLSHQLRGSGRTYGFRDVTRIAKAMERVMIKIQAKQFPADDRVKGLITHCIDRLETIFES